MNYYHQKWLIVLIIIVGLILAFTTLVFFLSRSNIEPTTNPTPVFDNLPISDPKRQLAEKLDRPSFGNPDAKLVIVEFSDFQCPVCQAEFPIIREIISKYQDRIFFIYRQYPIINENSLAVSMASLCAQEQNKFWPMHDRLFLKPSNNFSRNDLNQIAQQAGLALPQFDNCLSSEKYKGIVTADFADAVALQVPGTPTFFVNGNRLSGQISKANWEIIIDQSLKLLNNK